MSARSATDKAKAVNFYLNELVLKIKATSPAFIGAKPTVVFYDDPAMRLQESTMNILKKLLDMGVAIEVKQADF